MKRKFLLISCIVIVFLALGYFKYAPSNPDETVVSTTQNIIEQADQISYQGQEGKNALELLKQKYPVEVKSFSGVGEFVDAINGVKPDEKHFWSFYVNGAQSNTGASTYITKSSDVIEWKLEEIK
jgi:hypothetical protein